MQTDAEIMSRYADSGDAEALREVIRRNGGMVLGTCRRFLGDPHAAEDAAQAVFILYSRKGRSLGRNTVLSGWLYQTAAFVSREALRARATRQRHEVEAAASRAREQAGRNEDPGVGTWSKIRAHLDGWLDELPAAHRHVLVMRYLEGRSESEVAAELECPVGTVSARVSRALARLRDRLARRRIALPVTLLATMLVERAAEAAPAPFLASAQAACTAGTAAPAALQLADTTVRALAWAKVKAAALVAGLSVSVAAGVPAAVRLLGPDAPPAKVRTAAPALPVAAAPIAAPAPAAGGRTWHVAPREMAGLPADAQVRTISEAARKAEPGDTVLIHDGIYRETVVVEKSGTAEKPIRFQAAPGERVVLTGADEIRDWRKEPGDGTVFSAPWPHRFIGWSKTGTHPGDAHHQMIGRCEQVFVLHYPMLQVLDRNQLGRGTFFADLEGKRLFVCPRDGRDLSKDPPLVEASSRQLLWQGKGAYVHLRGLRFRYAANMAQHGAALFEGDHGVVEDCVFESMNSSGATFAAADLAVRRCVFQDNGQLGFGACRAHNLLLTECVVRNNNVKGFDRGWEAGGDKLVLCRGAVLEKSQFVGNRGTGVWFDIGNEACVVRNCLIADNEDAGIFYEISYGLHAHDNVIVGNGFNETPGAWGAASGISLSSSPGCVVERNLLVGNREGFNFREQGRKTPLIDDTNERWVWNHDQVVRNNVLAWNRDAQTWGWFDINDGRHWPAALQEPGEKEKGKAAQDQAADYQAKDAAGAPVGLSLEKLKIAFSGNLYAAQPWQGLFHWGVPWKRHKTYARLEEVQAELKLEAGSQAAELRFENVQARDFRMPADSPALKKGCYPKGDVPGARLGAMP